MEPEIKKNRFEATNESPGAWLIQAMELKVAADRLYWADHPIQDGEATVSLISVYKMLIGLSFENLLKGIILLRKIEDSGKGGLPTDCYTHRIDELLRVLAPRDNSLESEEEAHLKTLTPYIRWAGRYPLPKKKEELIPITHSNVERRIEVSAWQKLCSDLRDRGWVTKGKAVENGGYRLYFE